MENEKKKPKTFETIEDQKYVIPIQTVAYLSRKKIGTKMVAFATHTLKIGQWHFQPTIVKIVPLLLVGGDGVQDGIVQYKGNKRVSARTTGIEWKKNF